MFSFSLEERISPEITTITIRYQISGADILRERTITTAVSDPAAAECIEIFHQKLITVRVRDIKKEANINDFRNTGIGKRKIIYEEAA